jgi:hypothetical protein
MSRIIELAFGALLLLSTSPVHDRFTKYKAIEAYEIRPGILMLPRYSADGQVCEIALEKLHYSPETVRLDSSLSREQIDGIFQELAPERERGPKLERDLINISGHSVTTTMDFTNVSIQIIGRELSTKVQRDVVDEEVVATIRWKARRCQ